MTQASLLSVSTPIDVSAVLSSGQPWASIDFETANHLPYSACQIAIVRYEGDKHVAEKSVLINPGTAIGAWKFTSIHGISARTVVGAQSFRSVWSEVVDLVKGAVFVAAHNAPFDRKVLDNCLSYHRIDSIPIRWECSLAMARQAWPKLSNHKLDTLARLLRIELDHHEALSDARACAKIVLAAKGPNPVALGSAAVPAVQIRLDGGEERAPDMSAPEAEAAVAELASAQQPPVHLVSTPRAGDAIMPVTMGLRITPFGTMIFKCQRCNVIEHIHGHHGKLLYQLLERAFVRHTQCEERAETQHNALKVGAEAETEIGTETKTALTAHVLPLSPVPAPTTIPTGPSVLSAFRPSEQQAVFFDTLRSDRHHVALRARAGTGKTTTLIRALSDGYTGEQSALFLAFNKSIAEELKARAPSWVKVATFNGLGHELLLGQFGNDLKLEPRKVRNTVKEIVDSLDPCTKSFWNRSRVGYAILCVEKALESTELPGKSLPLIITTAIAGEDPVDQSALREPLLLLCTEVMRAMWCNTKVFCFAEQLWRCYHERFFLPQYPLVLVDEAQDLNDLQIEIVRQLVGETGRVLLVGDNRQAIYTFRGSDENAFQRLITAFNARVLPLTVTRRCGKSIVALAARVVPDFTAHESAHEGEVRTVTMPDVFEGVQAGDIIVSRTNAPLIKLCLRMLSKGTGVIFVGRDIAKSLEAIEELSPGCNSLAELSQKLDQRYDHKISIAVQKDDPVDKLEDERDCLISILENSLSVEDACYRTRRLIRLCSEKKNDASVIRVMSTHQAKGLEADRVWCLSWTYKVDPELSGAPTTAPRIIPPKPGKPKRTINLTEEQNLWYVAVTRARHSLFLVLEPEKSQS